MNGYTKISKSEFYSAGGFSNPRCVRKASGCKGWTYWYRQN